MLAWSIRITMQTPVFAFTKVVFIYCLAPFPGWFYYIIPLHFCLKIMSFILMHSTYHQLYCISIPSILLCKTQVLIYILPQVYKFSSTVFSFSLNNFHLRLPSNQSLPIFYRYYVTPKMSVILCQQLPYHSVHSECTLYTCVLCCNFYFYVPNLFFQGHSSSLLYQFHKPCIRIICHLNSIWFSSVNLAMSCYIHKNINYIN